jgi:PIN domain nuclease of toxin-antitoxin system
VSFILDTHVFFWWIADHGRLEPRHRQVIEARSEIIYVSAVTGWEIGIKV